MTTLLEYTAKVSDPMEKWQATPAGKYDPDRQQFLTHDGTPLPFVASGGLTYSMTTQNRGGDSDQDDRAS